MNVASKTVDRSVNINGKIKRVACGAQYCIKNMFNSVWYCNFCYGILSLNKTIYLFSTQWNSSVG